MKKQQHLFCVWMFIHLTTLRLKLCILSLPTYIFQQMPRLRYNSNKIVRFKALYVCVCISVYSRMAAFSSILERFDCVFITDSLVS